MSDTGDTIGPADGEEELLRFRETFAQSPSVSALLHGSDNGFVLTNLAYSG